MEREVRTPIYDYIMRYVRNSPVRMHMPGHKGHGLGGWLATAYPLDITEIPGADSLYEADGAIAESERIAAGLFGSGAVVYSAGGTTLCIQAMLTCMKRERRMIFAGRNAHRTFLNACVLLDLQVEWLYPEDNVLLSGVMTPETIYQALRSAKQPACIYLTSPDYLGGMADIAKIAELCKRFDAKLLVDNAHGAHLAFGPINLHPIALGADLCCDSYHKFLPALTGAACVHCANPEDAPAVRSAMAMFGSTSPSYLILTSMDLCNRYMTNQVRRDLAAVASRIQRLKQNLRQQFVFCHGDIFHITIHAARCGYTGTALGAWLMTQGVQYEYADLDHLILLCSPATPLADLDRLEQVLRSAPFPNTPIPTETIRLPKPPSLLSMRTAAFAASEFVPIEDAVGRICAMTQPPCPPAVPPVICGERIDEHTIVLLRKYEISKIAVVTL